MPASDHRRLRRASLLLAACLACGLAACGDKPSAAAQDAAASSDTALPKPQAGAASVTGMSSTPGPGDVPLAGAPPQPAIADAPAATDAFNPNPEAGQLPGSGPGDPGTAAAEPGPQDAVAVIRDYYASIDAKSYARAYALWSDAGRASKQTPQQFADGFATTAHVTVEPGTPGNGDAGAGQRYLQVPVAVTATQADGSVRRFDGAYTLHRTVVDGASADQRAWRIASADLRELKP